MRLRGGRFLFKLVSFIGFFLFTNHISSGQLYINELLASPVDTEHDWIEIYNAGSSSIDLEGKYLSDDPDDLMKWQFLTRSI